MNIRVTSRRLCLESLDDFTDKNNIIRASELVQYSKALVKQAWRPEFNPWNPCKGTGEN